MPRQILMSPLFSIWNICPLPQVGLIYRWECTLSSKLKMSLNTNLQTGWCNVARKTKQYFVTCVLSKQADARQNNPAENVWTGELEENI